MEAAAGWAAPSRSTDCRASCSPMSSSMRRWRHGCMLARARAHSRRELEAGRATAVPRHRRVLALVEWPQLRAALPGVALLIFLLCAASFAIVLTLGGGPRATTLEVAIYQSLRADFDPQRAAALAMVQLALCAALALLAQRFGGLMPGLPALGRRPPRFDGQARIGRSADIAVIAMGLLLLLPPLTSLVASGLANITASPALLRASTTSLAIGIAAASVAFAFAWALASAAARSSTWQQNRAACRARGLDRSAGGAGHRLVHRATRCGSSTGLAAVAGHRHECADGPALRLPELCSRHWPAAARRHDRLCAQPRARGLEPLPPGRSSIPAAARSGWPSSWRFILSLGDLTAIALFGTPGPRHAAGAHLPPDGKLPLRRSDRHGARAWRCWCWPADAGRALERAAMIRLEDGRFRYEDMAMRFDATVSRRPAFTASSGRAARASRRCSTSSPVSSDRFRAGS